MLTYQGSLETRLNSEAKPSEFVPKPLLACETFFTLKFMSSHWRIHVNKVSPNLGGVQGHRRIFIGKVKRCFRD